MKNSIIIMIILLWLIVTTSCNHGKNQVDNSPLPVSSSILTSNSSPTPKISLQPEESNLYTKDKDAVESKLLEDLKSRSAQMRWNAAANLGMMKSERALPALTNTLNKDVNGQVRLLSAWALGRIGDKKASEALLKAVRDPWIDARPFAVWALGEIKDPGTVDSLGKILFIENETGTREAIVRALRKIGTPSVVPILINALKDDDENVRTEAASALGYLKDKRAVEPLAGCLDDDEKQVVLNALISLGNLKATNTEKDIQKLVKHKDAAIRHEAEKTLRSLRGSISPTAVIEETETVKLRERELEKLTTPSLSISDISAMNPEDTHNIGTLPIKIGLPVNVKKCIEDMKSEFPDIRSEAAWLLGNSKDKTAVPCLIAALGDEKSDVRWNAAKSLGKLDDSRALIPLIKVLDDPDKDVREDIIEALGRLHDEKAVKPLMKIIDNKNEHPYIKAKVVEALGRLGNYGAFDSLLDLLKNPSSEIRLCTVIALGRLKDKRALAPLDKMKSDRDKTVRECAVSAIDVIKGKRNADELDTFDPLER